MSNDNVMDSVNEVESVLNQKFVDILTRTVADSIQPNLLNPPFDENNIFLDNENAEPPTASPTSEYINFVVNYGGAIKTGKGCYNRTGIATAQVFTPVGTGWKRSGDIYSVVRKALQDCGWSKLVMSIEDVTYIKLGKSGAYRLTNIDISFRYYEGV